MMYLKGIILPVCILVANSLYSQQGATLQQLRDTSKTVLKKVDSAIQKYPNAVMKLGDKALSKKDSVLQDLQNIPDKFVKNIDKKVETYSNQISKKTEKTIKKLAKWEAKIKSTLEKVSPETAQKLFGNNQLTFATLMQKLKNGEQIVLQYREKYDAYRDKLTTSLKYLDQQKEHLDATLLKPLAETKANLDKLSNAIDSTEAIEQFIKERKKQLRAQAFQYLKNSKYLSKINKEVWYYGETMRNYKDIFNDEEKAEQLVTGILDKIPAFQTFMQQNSMLASMFGRPGDVASAANLAGLQTRTGVQSLIQDRIASGGTNAKELVKQQIEAGKAQLNQLKDKLLKSPSSSGGEMPDFKPNMQKTKTFKQRLEYGSNIQFARTNSLMPTTMDLALTVGYKLNDKSTAGLGASYKMGLGSIERIRFSTEGLSLRSFIDWKLKMQFFVSGGMEMNYLTTLSSVPVLIQSSIQSNWQQSALLGITKKIKVKTKWFKETKLQLLYDFLNKQHIPISQPILFRIGYSF